MIWLIAAAALLPAGHVEAGSPRIHVHATPVSLNAADAGQQQLGRLRFLGGVALRSSDPHFGGLSALRWYRGRLLAMSDEGAAFYAMQPRERHGRLIGMGAVSRTFLRGPDGKVLTGKQETDTESMEVNLLHGRRGDASISFGFERHDRIWTYRLREGLPVGKPVPMTTAPGWFARQPDNLGVEAMAGNRQVSLLISEGLKTLDGQASALLFRPGIAGRVHPADPVEIGIPAPGARRPSELAMIDPHHFLMLRRSWSEAEGFQVELDALDLNADRASIHRLAEFKPPIVTDNFEGMAVRKEGGRVVLYIIADDNFEKKQRTLLLKFRLD
ncbi:esterase-like activity of phytase family protein [Novosphingobium sp.]|uniref:esterase-like activity of phytase family protein n=1 Tax=Novosphingobium sp. TaxID=1874826 RepID=UPI0031DD0AE1